MTKASRLTAGHRAISRLPVLVGISAAGYGTKFYIDTVREQRIATELREREDAERRRRNAMLLDVYGDRETLEELEKAVQFYEKKE